MVYLQWSKILYRRIPEFQESVAASLGTPVGPSSEILQLRDGKAHTLNALRSRPTQ